MQENVLTSRQIFPVVVVSMSAEVMVRAFDGRGQADAVHTIFAAGIASILLWAFSALWLRLAVRPAPFACVLTAFALLFATAIMLLRAEQFYRYSSDEPLPAVVTVLVLLLVAAYAAFSGAQTVSRVGGFLLWVFLAALVLLLLSTAGQMQVTNLIWPTERVQSVLSELPGQLSVPVELLAFTALCPAKERGKAAALWSKAIWLRFALIAGMAVCVELVLGVGARQQAQAVYTISRIGGISVFQRLDALQTAVWLLLLLCKFSLLLCAAHRLLRVALPGKKIPAWSLCAAVLLLMSLAALLLPTMQQGVLTVGVVLCAVTQCIQGGCHAKKRSV